ncbi:LysR family glycine cleavage system transcriptional activator [Povalibacter uvarum]|uniref:LysR family glycine cleavage system transcriptional activator n=1 Tax=Povalibacter uvarum TaxID=732238 RepID=A0A841HM62_9GAMM|nr:LysR substrate-binding domain-containing protein [Povalibacter uvarum]MBB6093182.1 LysR family glycine cleavage system transcriptional activator [Povalibacter uvarum]
MKFLKTFQVAAARLSFKAAAEELFITPSAVSHQIKALEEQLGVPLFDRGPHSLTLTEAGEHYLQHIDSMFSRLESVTEQLKARYGRGVVRLHMPPFFATELLLPKLPALLEAQPDTDIHINTALAPMQTHPSDADVSIVVNATPDSGLDCHKLFSQAFVPACSPSLLLRTPINTVEDLNQHTLIVHEARRDGWERWAESLGTRLRPKKIVRFDTMAAAAEAAEHGVGVALVASRIGNDRFEQGSLVRLFSTELQTGESYFLLLRREDANRPDVRALTQWLLNEFRIAA